MNLGKMFYNLAIGCGYKPTQKTTVVKPGYLTYPQQSTSTRITSAEIAELLDNNAHISPLGSKFNQADGSYKLVDIAKLKSYLAINPVSERTYVKESHDCDDFSFILQGDISRWDSDLAFGIIWGEKPSGGAHAWNWCVGEDEQIWFVEPQTDGVFCPEDYWDIWWAVM